MDNKEEKNVNHISERQSIKIVSKAHKEELASENQERQKDIENTEKDNTKEDNDDNLKIVMGKDINLIERKKRESAEELEKLQSKSKLQKFFCIETLQKICLWLAYFSGALFVVISFLMIFVIFKIFPQDSPLFGFDLIPAVYIWYPFVFALICSLIAKKFKISIFFAIVMGIFIFCTSDCSFFYKNKDASKQPAYGKTYKVATLNTAQYDKGFENIGKICYNVLWILLIIKGGLCPFLGDLI